MKWTLFRLISSRICFQCALCVRLYSGHYGVSAPLCRYMTPSCSADCTNRLTGPQDGTPTSEFNTSIMLDNDEFILDPYPRELTQNPLKKIWMPYKNGHISQRRGKMQPAGEQRDREEMPLIDLIYQLNLSIRSPFCFWGFRCVTLF